MCLLSSAHSLSNQIQNANLNFLVFIGLGLIWGWWRNHVSEYLQYLLPETHSSPQRILFQGSFISYTIRFQNLTENAKIASKAIIISEFSNKYNRPLNRLTRAQKVKKNTFFFSNSYISEPKWPRYLKWVTL